MMKKAGNSMFTSHKIIENFESVGKGINIRSEDYLMLLNDMMAADEAISRRMKQIYSQYQFKDGIPKTGV